ncbi:ER lumen protein retaining receptor [Verticillium dahliae VDG1]|nr:ER lumen protein retaining receptor [Verticillium dahliae VDG1]
MLNQAVLLLAFAAASATAEVEVVQAVRIIENIKLQSLAASNVCTPAGTILFTGSANSTSTVALETELPAATGSGDGESAAARGMGISAVAAAAALVGAVFLL